MVVAVEVQGSWDGWVLERKGSLSRLKGNFGNHVDSKSKVNQRLFRRCSGDVEVLQTDSSLKIKKRHNSALPASIRKVLCLSGGREGRETSESGVGWVGVGG